MAEIRCRMTHPQTPTRSWHIHTDHWSLLWILSLLSNLEPALLNPAEGGSISPLVLTVNIHTARRPGKYQPESALLLFSLFSPSLFTYFCRGTLNISSVVVSSKSHKTRNLSQNQPCLPRQHFLAIWDGYAWCYLKFCPKWGIFSAQHLDWPRASVKVTDLLTELLLRLTFVDHFYVLCLINVTDLIHTGQIV